MTEATIRLHSIPPRLVRVLRADEAVRCPRGHRYGDTAIIWPHGCLRCTKRVPVAGGRVGICGEMVYVRDFRDGRIGVVHVDWREAHHMRRLQLSVDEVVEFLHLPWTRTAA